MAEKIINTEAAPNPVSNPGAEAPKVEAPKIDEPKEAGIEEETKDEEITEDNDASEQGGEN